METRNGTNKAKPITVTHQSSTRFCTLYSIQHSMLPTPYLAVASTTSQAQVATTPS